MVKDCMVKDHSEVSACIYEANLLANKKNDKCFCNNYSVIKSHLQKEKYNQIINEWDKKYEEYNSQMPIIIAVDSGKHNVKYGYFYKDESTLNHFESKVNEFRPSLDDISNKFIVNDVEYNISEDALPIHGTDLNKVGGLGKDSLVHKILTLKAISNVIKKTGRTKVLLAIGVSISDYSTYAGANVFASLLEEDIPQDVKDNANKITNTKDKLEIYKTYIESRRKEGINKKYTVSYFDSNYKKITTDVEIEDIIVIPETYSGSKVLESEKDSKYTHAYIVDIGGLTDSILPIIDKVPQYDMAFTDTKGMTYIYDNASQRLIKEHSEYSMTAEKIKSLIRETKSVDDIDTNSSLYKFLKSYIGRLTYTLMNLKEPFDRNRSELEFIGGGSLELKPFLEYYFTKEFPIKNPINVVNYAIKANVSGMLRMAMGQFISKFREEHDNRSIEEELEYIVKLELGEKLNRFEDIEISNNEIDKIESIASQIKTYLNVNHSPDVDALKKIVHSLMD